MSCYEIRKSRPLSGRICIQGSKNSVLPIMAAAVLTRGVTILHNCPDIVDVKNTIAILEMLGCYVERQDRDIRIDASQIQTCGISAEYSEKLRSSFLFMGPLIARCKKASIAMPGGCQIGSRPVDLHLEAFRKMGVIIREEGQVYADGSNLLDAYIQLRFPSVGATENILLLAAASGRKVVLDCCAKEPEIIELCTFLNLMGADITGAGSNRIVIQGAEELRAAEYTIGGDRICAGTYIAATGICGGSICMEGIEKWELAGISEVVEAMGIRLLEQEQGVCVQCEDNIQNPLCIETGPFPGFPTDMQSQMLVLACMSQGTLLLKEQIFENRFQIVPELQRMGADIEAGENFVVVHGGQRLTGCQVEARELRGGAALVLAGLGAEGVTTVSGIRYICRGYENIIDNLTALGADVRERE